MNPNPEQPDAPPFVIDSEGELLVIRETRSLLYVASFNNDQRNRERALITCASLNAATALHAAGWDAARVFERLPEVMEALEASAGTIASLVNHNSPCADKTLSEIIHILAQLKLKRDTAGGGR